MPGKAKSVTLKRREARARYDWLMTKALAAYRAELTKPEEDRLGARKICEQFSKQHLAATGEDIPLSRSTLMRLAAGGKTISKFNAEKRLLTDEEEETVSVYLVDRISGRTWGERFSVEPSSS